MCGIVGYIGDKQAFPILMNGLRRLEYRGYDSAGCALISDDNVLNVYKAKGRVADLEQEAGSQNTTGTLGMSHTRWATHGEPSAENAHPHVSESGKLALVHNGIIEPNRQTGGRVNTSQAYREYVGFFFLNNSFFQI